MTILVLIGMVFVFKDFSASSAISELYEIVQVGIDLYITHRKY